MILQGINVLDLTHVIAGPYCARLLADMGADVVKVDRPPESEGARTSGSPQNNAGKRSIALDLSTDQGRAIARELAAWADVLIENFAPGVLDRLGLGYDRLSRDNPGLVYASISGFGQEGSQASRRAFGASAHAEAGFLWVQQRAHEDQLPLAPGVQVADMLAAQNTLAGILGGLFHRERTGRGVRVDVSLLDSQMAMMTEIVGRFLAAAEDDWTPPRHPIYRSADGRDFTIHAGGGHNWRRLAEGLGHDESAEQMPAEPIPVLAEWIGALTAEQVSAGLTRTGAPFGLVQTLGEAVRHPAFGDRGLFVEVPDPLTGTMRTVGAPIRLDGEAIGPSRAAPLAGEHTREILVDVLGWADEQVEVVLQQGAAIAGSLPARA